MIINLHLLDACDFRCAHCFAHFGARKTLPRKDWQSIVDNILDSINVERFNLAGGEPLLYGGLAELAEYIRSKGKAVSIITNGHSLSRQKIDILSECGVSMIGLSIDSPNASTLRKLGRCTASGNILEPDRCVDLCRHIRARGMSLKINSVISQLNLTEDFSSFIRAALPCRWKLLKIKEFKNDFFNNTPLLINDPQFDNFILRHRSIPHVVERTMANAYIMVDAFGNLVDNGSNDNTPVADLLNVSFRDAFMRLKFDYNTYDARYAA
jgi:radical S-adenosyl methionine domain-containing protein 2